MALKIGESIKIRFTGNGEERLIDCEKNSNLMDVFHRNNLFIEAPCGGKGICGKCKVRLGQGEVSEITEAELKFLSAKEKDEGYRLACLTEVYGDLEVFLDDSLEGAEIMQSGLEYSVDILPSLEKHYLELEEGTVEDQRDDLLRISEKLGIENPTISLELLRKLPSLLREADYNITVALDGDEILSIEEGNSSYLAYGVAIDIGTTTIVAYLMDLVTGRQIDVISGLNIQKSYGGDVISRIQHTMENEDGLLKLKRGIVNQIGKLIEDLSKRNNIDLDHIYNLVIVGNTIMGHFLLGLDPRHISLTPFTPVVSKSLVYPAKDFGLELGEASRVFLPSHISGYVGSDVLGGILATDLNNNDDIGLIIDIGTNGEIILGNKDRMVSCSTAAGPAFEGANIRYGMGGVRGAISTLRLENGNLKYTVIGDEAPIGICGSGIVDALAILLDSGLVDETGRLLDEDEIESDIGKNLSNRLIDLDGVWSFILASEEEARNGEPIVITQKDIREIQLAKAAIAAGVKVLVDTMDIDWPTIKNLYLAGGFGSFIDKRNATRIGLIPKEMEDRITSIGNGAGTGAMLSLINKDYFKEADKIKVKTEYVELSSTLEFQDAYVDAMYFE